MKKFCVLLLAVLLLMPTACSEIDIHGMTDEELYALRTEINNEIAVRAQAAYVPPEGKKIAEIFPDLWLAMKIRDELGKFSTSDIVTQEELDTITSLILIGQFKSLEGVQYLRNLDRFCLSVHESVSAIPDWIGNLENLTYLSIVQCSIDELPDSICNLANLESLYISGTNISALPENIGNLSNLGTLDISKTDISTLPESIGNLSALRILDISNTKITELPESFSSLDLVLFIHQGLDLD